MTNYFLKYIRLFRLKTMLIYLFPFVLALSVGLEQTQNGTARAAPYSWVTVLFGYLAFFCGSFFGSTLNCYADVPADLVHNGLYKDQDVSKQPFVTGMMSNIETVALFTVTSAGCVVFSLLVNVRFAFFMIGTVLLLGVLYSHPWFRFKAKPVLDVVCNVGGAVLILIAGMSVVSSDYPPAIPIIFGSIFSATMYLPSVANDAPFDRAAGYKTSGVYFGQKRLINAMVPLTVILIPVGLWGVFSKTLNWQYRLFMGVGIAGAIVFTALSFILYNPPHIELNANFIVAPLAALLLLYVVLSIYRLAT